MKYLFIIIVFIISFNALNAQQDSGILPRQDSQGQTHKKAVLNKTIKTSKQNIKTQDSIKIEDSTQNDTAHAKAVPLINDSLKNDSINKKKKSPLNNYDSVLETTGIPVFGKPKFMLTPEKIPLEKNELFYAIAGVIFLLALVKKVFPNYLQNTFGLFLQTTGVNTNTKYIAHQNGPAFILMQLVFVFCTAIYFTLISSLYLHIDYSFFETLLFSIVFIGGVYLAKDLAIKFLGWVFNLKAEAKVYLLYVFLVNRVLAISLIPVILVLAFSQNNISYFALIVSFILLAVSLIYRYFLTIKTIQPKLQAKTIQIFLYLCTVEFLPIVLLYKLIVNYTNGMN